MQPSSKQFLFELLNTISPSGFEVEAARVWRQYAAKFALEVHGDVHGNSIAVINRGGGPRVMLAGHADEIGFLVSHIDDKGYLYLQPVGGWDSQIAQGQRVWVNSRSGRVLGVLGKKPIHLMDQDDRRKAVDLKELWVDIAATSKEQASALVAVGDPVVLAWGPAELQNEVIVGRGLDDRVGAFVVLEAARIAAQLNPQAEVVAVATVQEEIGLRGAITSTYGVAPTVGVAVDVCHATDYPGMDGVKKQAGDIRLGHGPVVARGANINRLVHERLVATAKEHGIKHQLQAAARGTGTDANAMQLSRGGVATGLVSIPNRYMHSPCELVHLDDLEAAAELLARFCASLSPTEPLLPW